MLLVNAPHGWPISLSPAPYTILADGWGRLGCLFTFLCGQSGSSRRVEPTPQMDANASTDQAERAEHAGQCAGADLTGDGQDAWRWAHRGRWLLRDDGHVSRHDLAW